MTFRQLLTGPIVKHNVCHSQPRDFNFLSTCLADVKSLILILLNQIISIFTNLKRPNDVSRYRDPQLRVAENYSYLFTLSTNIEHKS